MRDHALRSVDCLIRHFTQDLQGLTPLQDSPLQYFAPTPSPPAYHSPHTNHGQYTLHFTYLACKKAYLYILTLLFCFLRFYLSPLFFFFVFLAENKKEEAGVRQGKHKGKGVKLMGSWDRRQFFFLVTKKCPKNSAPDWVGENWQYGLAILRPFDLCFVTSVDLSFSYIYIYILSSVSLMSFFFFSLFPL